MASGVPIITSRWYNVDEVVSNEKDGLIYEFDDLLDFNKKLKRMVEIPSIYKMKVECLKEAYKFKGENAIKILIRELKNG